jgi:predicted deacylase
MAGTFGVWIDIDLENPGKRAGLVHIPNSRNRDGWGCTQIPICVIKNGDGPTVLLMGGNHGDEYEGQLGLTKLFRKVNHHDVAGRLIILPSANYPACEAGSRLSPLDNGNLNRAFPGRPDGSMTERIAHFISFDLFPISQWHIDLHAGGEGDDFIPVMTAFLGENDAANVAALKAVKLIGAPYYVAEKVPASGQELTYASGGAVSQGLIALGGEFGGGGSLSNYGLQLIGEGVLRVLSFIGVYKGAVPAVTGAIAQQRIRTLNASAFCYANRNGIFESYYQLGDQVKIGDVCGLVHSIEDPSREPDVVTVKGDGIIISQKHARRVRAGACLAALARPIADE